MGRVHPLATAKFLKLLQRRFNCSFVRLKGDHLQIVRGVLHSTIPVANRELRPDQIKYILSDLGIAWRDVEQHL